MFTVPRDSRFSFSFFKTSEILQNHHIVLINQYRHCVWVLSPCSVLVLTLSICPWSFHFSSPFLMFLQLDLLWLPFPSVSTWMCHFHNTIPQLAYNMFNSLQTHCTPNSMFFCFDLLDQRFWRFCVKRLGKLVLCLDQLPSLRYVKCISRCCSRSSFLYGLLLTKDIMVCLFIHASCVNVTSLKIYWLNILTSLSRTLPKDAGVWSPLKAPSEFIAKLQWELAEAPGSWWILGILIWSLDRLE